MSRDQFSGRGYDNDKFGYLPGGLQNEFITEGHNKYRSGVAEATKSLQKARRTTKAGSEERKEAKAGVKLAKADRSAAYDRLVSTNKAIGAARKTGSKEAVSEAKQSRNQARKDLNQNYHGSFQNLKSYSGSYKSRVGQKKEADKKKSEGGGLFSKITGLGKKSIGA